MYLFSNQLTSIPQSIGELSSLEELFLGYNQLTSLPESICNLPNDCYIHVYANYLCEEYSYDCISLWNVQDQPQDQTNCCEGPEGQENWTTCP